MTPHTVAIVGMGPRGLYCLERLIAEFHARPLRAPLNVVVFNRSADFGTSPIYDPRQPDYLLVNVAVGEIDFWEAGDPPVVAAGGADFVDWYHANFPGAGRISGDRYLPRSVVGRYFRDCFRRVVEQAPQGLAISCEKGEVVDLEPSGQRYLVHLQADSGGRIVAADKVMLATGHSRLQLSPQMQEWAAFAASGKRAQFIPHVYPVHNRMESIPAGARVGAMGIGLTFIDAVLAVTEGRGGRFVPRANGLLYRPSGREPAVVLPYSRSGLPMAPKADDLTVGQSPLRLVTREALHELRLKAPGGRLELDPDVWGLVELELQMRYLEVVSDPDEKAALADVRTPQAARAALQRAGAFGLAEPLDLGAALDPAALCPSDSLADFNGFVAGYMRREIDRARLGRAGSGEKAAFSVWYDIRAALGTVLCRGGFTPRAHRELVEDIFPRFKRVAFGPPRINIEKLLALQEAGLIDFCVARRPRVAMNRRLDCFELVSATGGRRQIDVLVDARYPQVDVARDASPLWRNLQRRGMVRAMVNPSSGGEPGYQPGAVDMSEPFRNIVGSQGRTNPDICVIGVPTEGNLIGNLTLERDPFAAVWARQVVDQLRTREESSSRISR